MRAHLVLTAQGAQMARETIELAPCVWSRVGFAVANVHRTEWVDHHLALDAPVALRKAEAKSTVRNSFVAAARQLREQYQSCI